jgi:hypothetical protein
MATRKKAPATGLESVTAQKSAKSDTAARKVARKSATKSAAKPARKAATDKLAPKGARTSTPPAKKAAKTPPKGKAAPKADKPPVAPATSATPEEKPFGRPTVYRDEYCQRLIQYFRIEVERTEAVVVPDAKAEGGTRTEMVKVPNTFPTLTRFADSIDVTRQTLHDWATATVDTPDGPRLKHPDFSYAYARAKDLQESLLIEGGIAGVYDSRFASLATKNLIGWRDQVEQTIEANVTTTSTDDLDAIYQKGIEAAKRAEEEAKARAAASGIEGMENGGAGA